MKKNDLDGLLKERILILDGAMGTMIQTKNLVEKDFKGDEFENHNKQLKGLNDLLSLTRPDVIKQIHADFLEAGSDIIETNTFNSTSLSLQDYGMEHLAFRLNLQSARLAKSVADSYSKKNANKPRFVAGSIGPTSKSSSISHNTNDSAERTTSFDELVTSYEEQIKGLIEGQVDILLVETVFDTLNCKAALFAIDKCFDEMQVKLPIFVSCTVTESGRLLSGQTLEAFLISISHVEITAIGLNCSLGSDQLYPFLKEISNIAPMHICCYPNAGLPNEMGEYDHLPDHMGSLIKKYAVEGLVNVVGGCCGSTPGHIKAISDAVSSIKPRQSKKLKRMTRLSGLEPLNITENIKFVNIGERANVTGSRKFANLIKAKKYEEALEVVRDQIDNGAQIIDINMDESMLDSLKEMTYFLKLIVADPDLAKVPVMIDSSKWSVISEGMKCIPGKGVVNSISLKEGEEYFKKQAELIKKMGFAAIVMAFDENGQADNVQKRLDICTRSHKILTEEIGFLAEDIIFDLNVFAVATGMPEHNNYAVDFINATKMIKEKLPYVQISGGLSNLSFSFRGNNFVRAAMHSVFLYHAIQSGMRFGIVNPGHVPVYDELESDLRKNVEDVILNISESATENLIDFAENNKAGTSNTIKTEKWRGEDFSSRMIHAIKKGITKYIDQDLEEGLVLFPNPVDIVEGPLMKGMEAVGELFGEGKMFLPQVIKSARVMKKAVSFLTPYIEKETGSSSKPKGTVLLATVKGDVHDIGKNIVEVVLRCNNYEVINIGEMVPCDKILKEAKKVGADIIGLSGLITPSLDEMINVSKEMKKQKFEVPLLIGGATTSKIHTAVKIAPEYSKGVVYVEDASQSVTIVSSLLNEKHKIKFLTEVNNEYDDIRKNYLARDKKTTYLSLDDSRANKLNLNWSSDLIKKPATLGVQKTLNVSLDVLIPFINWDFFLKAWTMNSSHQHESEILIDDAKKMLAIMIQEKNIEAKGVFGMFAANSSNDDIEIYEKDDKKDILTVVNCLRQQKDLAGKPNLSLSDFVAPKETGLTDYLGFFAVTAGTGIEEFSSKYKESNDDYNFIMVKILSDRLAEAFAEYLHLEVRKKHWGYSRDEDLTLKELFRCNYQGIRPAPGYPVMPDHSFKKQIFDLLGATNAISVGLSDSFMMLPVASVCGLYFANEYAKYFATGEIQEDQLNDYAVRKNKSVADLKKILASNIF